MDGPLADQFLTALTLGGLVACLGVIFLVVQERTRPTVSLGIFWIAAGLYVITVPFVVDNAERGELNLLIRLHTLFDAVALTAVLLYISGLLSTAQSSPRAETVVRAAVRTAYALTAVVTLLGLAFPVERANDYMLSAGDPGVLSRPGFWMFAVPYLLLTAASVTAWIAISRQQLDVGEHARAVCNSISVPFLAVSTALPNTYAQFTFTISVLVFLLGQFRFLVAQGERGVFLSRFLSPQVSEMVRLEGMAAVMQPREVDLTAVACDLRGFTAYAEAVPSQAVIDLLGEFYDAIGDVVAEAGGTIKDYAGDGILVLVGAPLTRSDHAPVGLALASRIIDVGHRVTEHWATGPHPLGLGVGVASGRVTVGAVGSTGRTEYTAVGAPVNLAARLCSAARDGEVLLDQRTAELVGVDGLEPRGSMQLKGLSSEVAVFAVPASRV